jgi:hypothetical protein
MGPTASTADPRALRPSSPWGHDDHDDDEHRQSFLPGGAAGQAGKSGPSAPRFSRPALHGPPGPVENYKRVTPNLRRGPAGRKRSASGPAVVGHNGGAMSDDKPKQHFPTPEERDERHKIEDVSPEDALKILLGTPDDGERGESSPERDRP